MNKKCMGCGLTLQDKSELELGYTPNINNDYCKRCFRLKNYGEKKEENISNEFIIKKLKEGLVFFFIDYLNLNKDTLDIFKEIKNKKILIISKSDILRKDFKYEKIKNWLAKVYNINEEILFLTNKNNYKSINIFNIMDKYQLNKCYIMGITNAGKSTFLNSLLKSYNINKEILVSSKPNTTLDFIPIHIDKYIIYDTPGFIYNNHHNLINSIIKPINFNLKKPTKITIDNIDIYFLEPNNITIYSNNTNIKRSYNFDINNLKKEEILDNYDLVLPGIGFINIKNKCFIYCNNVLESRPNISGLNYE